VAAVGCCALAFAPISAATIAKRITIAIDFTTFIFLPFAHLLTKSQLCHVSSDVPCELRRRILLTRTQPAFDETFPFDAAYLL
jgi:hypothetical protein